MKQYVLSTKAMETITNDRIQQLEKKLEELERKFQIIESVNNDLIKANMKMTKTYCEPPVPRQSSYTPNNNGIFYSFENDKVYVSGNTYDVKSTIKDLGGRWYKSGKSWEFTNIDIQVLKDAFPDIKQLGSGTPPKASASGNGSLPKYTPVIGDDCLIED